MPKNFSQILLVEKLENQHFDIDTKHAEDANNASLAYITAIAYLIAVMPSLSLL